MTDVGRRAQPGSVLRLATRGSPLALRQAEQVAEGLRAKNEGLEVEPVVVTTRGDRMAEVSLQRIGGQGAFVKEIQLAVLEGRADAAVHSAKDLPGERPAGLMVACVPQRADPRDVLVGRALSDLSPGSVVATGSVRRRAQLANLRPELSFVELRGNVGRRLGRVEEGEVDAVVTALAALDRLGQRHRAAEVLHPSVLLPQVGQGALAVECREDDAVVAATLQTLDDPQAHRCLRAERAVLTTLGASCAAPFGALARPAPLGEVAIEAMLASGDGRVVVRARRSGPDPEAVGREAARALFGEHGASSIEGVVPPVAP